MNRSADLIDQASEQEAMFHANNIKAVQDLLEPQSHPDFNGVDCLDCGEVVPDKRLAFGRIRCTSCESLLEEKDNKLKRRK